MEEDIVDKNEEELMNEMKLLNVIFSDLNSCIKDQSKKIDSIENNMHTTDITITVSNDELVTTNNYKKEINKKYLTLAGLGGIIMFLFFI
jgi:hypothetical protein